MSDSMINPSTSTAMEPAAPGGYYLEYQALLREAEQKGLPSDYTSAPMREARRWDCGLRRSDVAKGGNKNT